MATRKKKNNIGAFGHPIYGKGFAKYGEMRPSGSSEIPKDLEEAAEKWVFENCFDCDIVGEHRANDGFIAGAKWQKEQDDKELSEKIASAYQLGLADKEKQMMKEAVEGEVVKDINNKLAVTAKNVNLDKFKFGDKVRIIIVKE